MSILTYKCQVDIVCLQQGYCCGISRQSFVLLLFLCSLARESNVLDPVISTKSEGGLIYLSFVTVHDIYLSFVTVHEIQVAQKRVAAVKIF